MNHNKSITFLLFLIALVGFSACSEDAKPEEEEIKPDTSELIAYNWSCVKAIRNGRPAASLDGLFFDFSAKDTLTSNMMGESNSNPYSIKSDTIYQRGDYPVEYAIVNLDSANMQLNMEMNATKFSFYLVKSAKVN